MSDPHPLFDKNTFLRDWIIATIVGLILGILISWYIPRLALSGAKALEHALAVVIPNWGVGQVLLTLPSYLVTTTSVGTIVGLCLSLAQGAVLQKWAVVWAREWLVAGGMGAVFSYLLMAALNILAILFDPDPRLLKGLADSGLWIGAIMGIVQWRVLRKHSDRAGWWMVVSTGLWGIGSMLNRVFGNQAAHVVGSLLIQLFRMGWGGRNTPAPRFFVMGQVVIWLVAGGIGGLVTGKALKWLTKNWLEA